MPTLTTAGTCLCGHDALDHFDDVRHCGKCECSLYRYDPVPDLEPHRVCSVDLRYVTKAEYPNAAAARVAADEIQAKHGGLWFAAHHSYFKAKPDPDLGHDPITVIEAGT